MNADPQALPQSPPLTPMEAARARLVMLRGYADGWVRDAKPVLDVAEKLRRLLDGVGDAACEAGASEGVGAGWQLVGVLAREADKRLSAARKGYALAYRCSAALDALERGEESVLGRALLAVVTMQTAESGEGESK
jgi:hypothetical protein